MTAERRPYPSPDFSLSARAEGDRVDVALVGDLDMAATFKLEPELDRLLAGDGVRRLVLDLAGVGFMDSSGLGALLSIRERARDLEVELRLANVSEPVQRILEVSGTQATFAE